MSHIKTFHQVQGEKLIEKVKAEYAAALESFKQKGISAESLDFLAAVEQKTHHYGSFVNPQSPTGFSLTNEYPRVKISEAKLKRIEKIVAEEDLILHPGLTDFGFPLAFDVLYGERTPSGRKITHRLLTFHQRQVPPNYNVDIVSSMKRLRPTLLRPRNLELVTNFGLEPIDATGAKYFY